MCEYEWRVMQPDSTWTSAASDTGRIAHSMLESVCRKHGPCDKSKPLCFMRSEIDRDFNGKFKEYPVFVSIEECKNELGRTVRVVMKQWGFDYFEEDVETNELRKLWYRPI